MREELAQAFMRFAPHEGFNNSPIPSVQCIKYSSPSRLVNNRWRAAVCIVLQGTKELVLGREIYRSQVPHTIVSPLDLPVTSRVSLATPQRPFLCLRLDFDSVLMDEMASQLDLAAAPPQEAPLLALFVREATDGLLAAAFRLIKLFSSPQDAQILGPLVVREILYNLLKGPDGPAIQQFVHLGSKWQRMTQIIHRLRSDLADPIDVEALARTTNMSRSAFFKVFKDVTAMSPIQYQKRLRLLEARRLMIEENQTAEGSAFGVGYKSVSQFSREYSRMFGAAPGRETRGRSRQSSFSIAEQNAF